MPDDGPGRGSGAPLLLDAVRAAAVRGGLLAPGEHVLVGVSGGPDSVALLHALVLLRSELGLELTPIEEGLRGTFRWYEQQQRPRPDFSWEDSVLASAS